jgi:O-antigen/teichoic acid export membrane protein
VQFLNSLGYPYQVVVGWLLCCVANISLNFWAVPKWGITGASIVSSLCYVGIFVFVLVLKRRLEPDVNSMVAITTPVVCR